MDPLNRDKAPFSQEVWSLIDRTATSAAIPILTARRFLDVEGPFGLGLTSVEAGADDLSKPDEPSHASVVIGGAISVPMLWRGFSLSLRRLAAYRESGQPINLTAIAEAAESIARLEERLIYLGDQRAGLAGLLTAKGVQRIQGGDWSHPDQTIRDAISAVTVLDDAGFSGPYALVVPPHIYNNLFRRYADSDLLQVDHLGRLCQAGIHKALVPATAVIDPRAGRLMVGQDMMAGFSTSDGIHCQMFLSESMVLALDDARAVCRINAPSAA